MRNQIASMPALVADTVVWLFGDAEKATESGPDTKVSAVIRKVISPSVASALRSSPLQIEV